MPIYEFIATDESKSCEFCLQGFEQLMRVSDAPLTSCPQCGSPVKKNISAPFIGSSKSGLDDRAKAACFHKLKKLGKGEYEKTY